MKKIKLNLSKQLIIITLLSLLVMIISISMILPVSLEPFFEETVFSYLRQPLDMFKNDFSIDKRNEEVVYITQISDEYYISSNYQEVLEIEDYTKLIKYITNKQGSFTYKNKKYYYFKKIEKNRSVIAITSDNYIKNLRKDYFGIIIPIVVITYFVILILLIVWSKYIVNRLEKLKLKVDNMNNENFNVVENKYEFDDEIMLLDDTIDEMKKIILSQDKYKSEMYQNISHDFKTPISVIKSYIEAYNDGIESYENVINVSDEEIKKLENKVKTLMQLNKITYLQNSYKNDSKVNVIPIINETVDKYKIINNKINYEIKCDKKEIFYSGNNDIFESIVNNLLSNAIRYAKKEIIITVKEDKIIFFNDGENIDKDIMNTMFERFKKGKNGENGIGLSIVKSNCDLIKCSISVKNKKNGVEFIITKGTK